MYTCIPTPDKHSEVLHEVRNKVKVFMIESLDYLDDKFNLSIDHIKNNLMSIDCSKKIKPNLFYINYMLSCAIKNASLTEIFDAIQRLNIELEEGVYADEVDIDTVLSNRWEREYVEELRKYDQVDIRGEKTIVRPIIDKDELHFHKDNIIKAIDLIKENDHDIYLEFLDFVTDVKIFQGRVLRGDTSAKSFGAMWIRIPEKDEDQVGYWVEHIVHEVSHLRLEALFFSEKLVENLNNEKVFKAPIRDDLRPLKGVFHATFVTARMVRVFRKISIAGLDKRFRDRLRLCELQFDIGIESVYDEKAKLSDNGVKIRETFRECAYS